MLLSEFKETLDSVLLPTRPTPHIKKETAHFKNWGLLKNVNYRVSQISICPNKETYYYVIIERSRMETLSTHHTYKDVVKYQKTNCAHQDLWGLLKNVILLQGVSYVHPTQ